MSTRYARPYICPNREEQRQQGLVSMGALVLLVVMVFMGRGLVHFVQQGAAISHGLRQEMHLRLAAESMVEKHWLLLKKDDSKLQSLRADTSVFLEKGTHEGFAYTVFARNWGGEIYIIATAFRRETEIDKIAEPHVMVKGVLGKEGEHYVWRGWAP